MDERVQIYTQITGFTPSIFQQDLIADRIKDVDRWRKAVIWWAGNAYRPQSVLKVIEYYEQMQTQATTFRRPDVVANDAAVWATASEPACNFCGSDACFSNHYDERQAIQ